MILELFVFVLLEPLKSAEPPISCGRKFEIFSIAAIEHCRVAKLGLASKCVSFSSIINFSKPAKSNFSEILVISLLTFGFFYLLFQAI